MQQSSERYSATHDDSDPHAPRPYFDMQAAVIMLLIFTIMIAVARVTTFTTSAPLAPISTPAAPASAPIYYQPVPTLYPIAAPPAAPQRIDNSDHRICIFVVDCS